MHEYAILYVFFRIFAENIIMDSQLDLFPENTISLSNIARKITLPLKRMASDRKERLALRNRAMVARKYYWEEIMRRRPDDVTVILAEHEFFVDERTIQNALMENADFYTDLCRRKVTARQLQKMFPTWKF
nr:MAG TPA: hypothetical protein [Caudoviricetes sp.]